jgi:hypothetical protein
MFRNQLDSLLGEGVFNADGMPSIIFLTLTLLTGHDWSGEMWKYVHVTATLVSATLTRNLKVPPGDDSTILQPRAY